MELNYIQLVFICLLILAGSVQYLRRLSFNLTQALTNSDEFSGGELSFFHLVIFILGGVILFLFVAQQVEGGIKHFILFTFYFLLWLISFIDYHYRLISIFHCFLLLIIGLYLVQFGLLPIPFSLQQSLFSLTCCLGGGTVFYFICQVIFRREVFGFGDFVLISATATVLSWQVLAYYLLVASITGILAFVIQALWQKNKIKEVKVVENSLPFAPFLNLSAVIIFNLQAYLVIVPS